MSLIIQTSTTYPITFIPTGREAEEGASGTLEGELLQIAGANGWTEPWIVTAFDSLDAPLSAFVYCPDHAIRNCSSPLIDALLLDIERAAPRQVLILDDRDLGSNALRESIIEPLSLNLQGAPVMVSQQSGRDLIHVEVLSIDPGLDHAPARASMIGQMQAAGIDLYARAVLGSMTSGW